MTTPLDDTGQLRLLEIEHGRVLAQLQEVKNQRDMLNEELVKERELRFDLLTRAIKQPKGFFENLWRWFRNMK